MITQIRATISNQHVLNRWLIVQIIATLIIIIVSLPWALIKVKVLSGVMIVYLASELGGLLTKQHPIRMTPINSYIQCFVLPLGFTLAWYSLCKLIFLFVPVRVANVLVGVLILINLIIFLPIPLVYGKQIKNNESRAILLIVWLMEIVLVDFTHGVHVSYFFKAVVRSGFLGAVTFAIIMLITMREWGIRGPQLKPFWTTNTKWFTMVVVIMLIPLLLILGTDHWTPEIYQHSHWTLFLSSWEAGIAEEFTFRFGIFSIIYKLLHRTKRRLLWAIFLTSFSFGCLHLLNVIKQPLSTTLSQVVGAIFIGVVFQIIYLYSGQFWLPVITHFFFDWTGFVAAQGTTETWSTPVSLVAFELVILTVFVLCLLLWTQFGKRYLVMKEHADYLLS